MLALAGYIYGAFFIRPAVTHPELDQDDEFRFPFVISNENWVTLHDVQSSCFVGILVWTEPDGGRRTLKRMRLIIHEPPFDLQYRQPRAVRCPILGTQPPAAYGVKPGSKIRTLELAVDVSYELHFVPWLPWHRTHRSLWTMFRRTNGEAVWIETAPPALPPPDSN